MSIERIVSVQPQVSEQINHDKKRSVTGTTVEMPQIDDKASSSAITNNAKSLVHEFKPAETQEELLEQIGKIEWLTKKKVEIKDLSSLDKQGCKAISTFLNKAESLTPEFKKRIDIPKMLEEYNSFSEHYDVPQAIKELNISKLNKLHPEIVKQISPTYLNQFYSLFFSNNQVKEPELLNELHSLIPQDSRFPQYALQNADLLTKDKETTQQYIERVKMTHNLDKRVVKNMHIGELLESKLPDKKIQKMFEYINNLPESQRKAFFDNGQIHNILTFDYSYSVDANPKTIKLGTPEHIPAKTKSQLINELATFRANGGFFMFQNKEIDAIVNNENNVAELSKILNKLKTGNIELSRNTLSTLLTKEGLTAKLLEPHFTLIDNIQTNPKYASLKESLANDSSAFDTLFSNDVKPAQIEKNLELLDLIKEKAPYAYNPVSDTEASAANKLLSNKKIGYGNNFYFALDFLNNSNVDKKTLTKLLDSNIFENIEPYILNDICSSENLTKKNIQLVKDLKSNPKLSFIFEESYQPEKTMIKTLKKDIPEGFDISKKQEMIDFLAELHSNPKFSDIINKYNQEQYINILLKKGDENIDAGRKLVDKIITNDLSYHRAAEVLVNHSFSDSLNILTRVEQNPVLKEQLGDFMFLLCSEKNINFANQV
ncbi:MAG: hypothetical protein ACI4S3_10120, partial [Candidatus Gastranaerophilaceae bacterium]